MGKKERIKCKLSDTISDLKKLISFKTGTRPEKIKLSQGGRTFNDKLTLNDCKVLISQLSECSNPFICAHGRPNISPLFDFNQIL